MLNVYGKTSLRAFIGANGMLVLFLPSIVSPAYRHFISDWWIYMLTIYVLLSIVVTRSAFKDYHFKVSLCLDVGHLMCSFTHARREIHPGSADRLEWRFRVPIGNNGAMHFSGYPEAYNHAHSLHVYFWHIWVPCIPIRTRNCVNTLIHILYNFQTIWVQCNSMRTQNCINTLVHFLYIYYTIWVQARTLTDVVADVISWLLSLNVNKIK